MKCAVCLPLKLENMLQQYASFPASLYQTSLPFCVSRKRHTNKPSKLDSTVTCQLVVRLEDLAEISHNKVVIAAGVSAAVGQLSKPFTSVILYGKDLDFKSLFQAGGFPSSHSSAVVATATSLGLERGFSDSIFGLALVYAGLVMYDSQGVRREVGNHAKTLNRLLIKRHCTIPSNDTDNTIDSQPVTPSSLNLERPGSILSEEGSNSALKTTNAPSLLTSDNKQKQNRQILMSSGFSDNAEGSEVANSYTLLKESVGHTEVEVIAGALLGFLVSLSVYTIM